MCLARLIWPGLCRPCGGENMHVLIVLGGETPGEELLRSQAQKADFIIAADLGAQYALAAGVMPHLVLGDMDSLPGAEVLEKLPAEVQVRKYPCEKDETDGQLAVDAAIVLGAQQVTVLGALGRRLDHALGNLLLLIRLARSGVQASLLDEHTCVKAVKGSVSWRGHTGDILSLIPFGDGVHAGHTAGLKYALDAMTLLPCDAALGVSNEFTAEECSFCIEGGWAFAIHIF